MEKRYPEPVYEAERHDTPELGSTLGPPVAAGHRTCYYVASVDYMNQVKARLSPAFEHELIAISALDDVRSRTDPHAVLVIEGMYRSVRRPKTDPVR